MLTSIIYISITYNKKIITNNSYYFLLLYFSPSLKLITVPNIANAIPATDCTASTGIELSSIHADKGIAIIDAITKPITPK